MFGLYAMDGTPPFHTIALHGMVRDQFGKKMSKSFGNAVNPLDWMDAYGSDAVRFTLARGANPGVDVPIGEDWVQASRNFANKIWNATRFALMNGATVEGELPPAEQLSAADRWILSRLNAIVAEVDAYYDDYQFAKLVRRPLPLRVGRGLRLVRRAVQDHVLRGRRAGARSPAASSARSSTSRCGCCTRSSRSSPRRCGPRSPARSRVVIADWPADSGFRDAAAEREIELVQQVVTEVRRFRSDQGLQPGQKVPARLSLDGTALAPHEAAIRQLLRLQPEGEGFSATATLPVAGATVALDLSGTIDVDAERKRLAKDLAAAEKEKAQAQAKLGNEAFLAKAPDNVVDKIRTRLAKAEEDIARITAQLDRLPQA